MNWNYIAGYFDGEGCILLGITKDKRIEKTKGSQVNGWSICPAFSILSFDYETLGKIQEFLCQKQFNCCTPLNVTRLLRTGQTKIGKKIQVMGWKQLDKIASILIPRTIVKRKQLELLLELSQIVKHKKPQGCKLNRYGVWTKELFIKAMEKVDEINALKSRKRGKMNANYFKELWKEVM